MKKVVKCEAKCNFKPVYITIVVVIAIITALIIIVNIKDEKSAQECSNKNGTYINNICLDVKEIKL